MACEKCSAARASDGADLGAVFTTHNGRRLYLAIKVVASHDRLGVHAAMFCETCWLGFLEQLGSRIEMKRLIDV